MLLPRKNNQDMLSLHVGKTYRVNRSIIRLILPVID